MQKEKFLIRNNRFRFLLMPWEKLLLMVPFVRKGKKFTLSKNHFFDKEYPPAFLESKSHMNSQYLLPIPYKPICKHDYRPPK